jgi:hypothetical protein
MNDFSNIILNNHLGLAPPKLNLQKEKRRAMRQSFSDTNLSNVGSKDHGNIERIHIVSLLLRCNICRKVDGPALASKRK